MFQAARHAAAAVASYASFSDGAPGVPAPPLYLVFDNQKYRIDKDQFIIGRGASRPTCRSRTATSRASTRR
jgi:hypothetical protein